MVLAYKLHTGFWGFFCIVKRCLCFLQQMLLYADAREKEEAPNTFVASQINSQAEQLMTTYGNSVLRLAYSYLHNMSDAEDILQDALIQFIKTQPEFETAEHEKSWLLRVAINLCKNKLSYNKVRKTDELSEILAAKESEDLAFVWDAVKQLPLKYREVVHLFYYEGYSTSQTAVLLSKNESTVRSLLHRARSKLKDVLKEVYDFGE